MLSYLEPTTPSAPFPDPETAQEEPNGLLAVGGCLSQERLLNAYRQGIFPWFGEEEPILWWSPNPRLVLSPEKLKVSKSLRKTLKKALFQVTFDQAFSVVIEQCSQPRGDGNGTWITGEMKQAYQQLHQAGHAHSVEAWQDGELVGGLYGIAIGGVFFGESMFSRISNSSKVAFVTLVNQLNQAGYQLIDCQVRTEHLVSLGAEEIPRKMFNSLLDQFCELKPHSSFWKGTL
jgi:leucyl/phenylalanyl-tRNA--protein transferase